MPEPGFPEMVRDQILALGNDAKRLINGWVKSGQHENLYLDFKRKKRPSTGPLHLDDQRNFAKAMSGFANSDGGLLVWGVVAEKPSGDPEGADVARGSQPISPLDTFVGELNSVLALSTKPALSGVLNIPVFQNRRRKSGWVVTYVPAGPNPPYRAEGDNGNNFYKRAGSRFYPMEPYDIRDVVFRFHYPKLEMTMRCVLREDTHPAPGDVEYDLIVEAINHGPRALLDFKLEVYIPSFVRFPSPGHNSPTRFLSADRGTTIFAYSSCQADQAKRIVYPGEHRRLLGSLGISGVRYIVGPSERDRIDSDYRERGLDHQVTCRLYGADMPPVEVRRPLRELTADPAASAQGADC